MRRPKADKEEMKRNPSKPNQSLTCLHNRFEANDPAACWVKVGGSTEGTSRRFVFGEPTKWVLTIHDMTPNSPSGEDWKGME